MDNKKKIDNVRTLKPLPKSTNTTPEEPTERSFLASLFKESSDNNPIEKQKAREALFREAREGGKSNKNTPPSSTFTK